MILICRMWNYDPWFLRLSEDKKINRSLRKVMRTLEEKG